MFLILLLYFDFYYLSFSEGSTLTEQPVYMQINVYVDAMPVNESQSKLSVRLYFLIY